MKVLCIGDLFVTPKMMQDGVAPSLSASDTLSVLFFGTQSRDGMRDIARDIESGRMEKIELPATYLQEIEDADLLIVHLCPVTRKVLEHAKRLKAIMSCRGGKENLDIEAATEKGIIVATNPAHNANAVAEYTIGMILSETRNVARADGALKKGVWREKYPNSETTIRELGDMTVGIVGFGSIGRLVAHKLSVFGCKVLISDPFVPAGTELEPHCAFATMDELLKNSDIVTLHARASKAIMGEEQFAKMKQNSYLINTSRAIAVDAKAFEKAMDSGKLLGAAIDVFETEPEIPAFYRKYDNITITNHRGGDTINSYKDAPAFAIKNYLGYTRGEELKFWANRK